MKACPLRTLALENSPENIRNFGSAVNIMEVGRDDDVRETIGCLEEHCAWWDGEVCTVLALSETLFGVLHALGTLDLTLYHKE